MGNNSPCKDCSDRCPGCHSKCDKYIKFRQELTARSEAIRKQKQKDQMYYREVKK